MKDRATIRIQLDASCATPEVVIRTARETELVKKIAAAIESCIEDDATLIAVYNGNAKVLLRQHEIIRVYTEPRKVIVCTDKGIFETRTTLQELEKTLDKERFVRISRFEIINMAKVASFDVSVSGTIQVIFDDGSATWVARRYVQAIEQRLDRLYMKGGQADE